MITRSKPPSCDRGQRLERRCSPCCALVPGHREVGGEDLAVGRVVLGDQHPDGGGGERRQSAPARGPGLGGRRRAGGGRDPEAEGAAEARRRSRPRSRRPSARRAGARWRGRGRCRRASRVIERVDLGEALEERALGRLGDADAGVAHRDLEPAAGRGRSRGWRRRVPASVNFTALPTRFISTCRSRVASQTQPGPARSGATLGRHLDVAAGGAGRHQRHDVAGEPAHVDRRGLERDPVRLELGQVEDVVEDRRAGGGRESRAIAARSRCAGSGSVRRIRSSMPMHAVHRRADLVAHRREELRLGDRGALGLAPLGVELGVALRRRRSRPS